MNLSPAFHDLRAAYQSEMDDLTSDTEGRDVLHQRLADRVRRHQPPGREEARWRRRGC